MEERDKNNNDFSLLPNQKKVYQNPFKRDDDIYKTNKIKSKQLAIFKKENLNNFTNRKQKANEIYKEQNIAKKKVKSNLSIKHLNNSNGNIFNFNKVIWSKKSKTILNKNKNKKFFGNSTKLIFKDNYKKSNNVESSLNILNDHKFANQSIFKNGNINQNHKYNISIDLCNNINQNYSQNEKNKYNIKTNNNTIQNKNSKYNNNDKSLKKQKLSRNQKNFNSDENILINKLKKKIKILEDFSNNKNIKNKANDESKEILFLSSKKTTEDIVRGLNSTMKGNNKSANTKPTNISSFVISEKNIELNNDIDDIQEKIKKNNIFKNSIFKEHMKFVNLNSNQPNFLLYDNYNLTKENESKFLNYELGLSNGLSGTETILWDYINQDEKSKSKIIELEHPLEYMERMAYEMLDSHKNLPKIFKDKEDGKKMKDIYYEMIYNNISNIDEMKKGENIHRIINLQINLKK